MGEHISGALISFIIISQVLELSMNINPNHYSCLKSVIPIMLRDSWKLSFLGKNCFSLDKTTVVAVSHVCSIIISCLINTDEVHCQRSGRLVKEITVIQTSEESVQPVPLL